MSPASVSRNAPVCPCLQRRNQHLISSFCACRVFMACSVVVYFLYSLPNIVLQNRIATCVLFLGTEPNLVRKLSAYAGVISPLSVS